MTPGGPGIAFREILKDMHLNSQIRRKRRKRRMGRRRTPVVKVEGWGFGIEFMDTRFGHCRRG